MNGHRLVPIIVNVGKKCTLSAGVISTLQKKPPFFRGNGRRSTWDITRTNWLLFSQLAVWVLHYWPKLYNLQLIKVDSKGTGSSGSASSPAFEDLLLLDYGI